MKKSKANKTDKHSHVAHQRLVKRRPRELKSEILWAIAMPDWNDKSKLTIYTGTWLQRHDAIKEHTAEKGWDWKRCKKHGDVCLRVRITAA